MGYSDLSNKAISSSGWIFLESWVKDGPFDLCAAEVILMDGLIKGKEINLGLIHFLIVEDFLECGHHVADHFALPGLSTDIHQEDEHLFWWDLRVNAT